LGDTKTFFHDNLSKRGRIKRKSEGCTKEQRKSQPTSSERYSTRDINSPYSICSRRCRFSQSRTVRWYICACALPCSREPQAVDNQDPDIFFNFVPKKTYNAFQPPDVLRQSLKHLADPTRLLLYVPRIQCMVRLERCQPIHDRAVD